jgi:hypothetical protein
VKKAVLSFPPFAGYDHQRVVNEATKIYGDKERVKKAVLSYPQFAGLDHQRVVNEATKIYGDKERVKKAVLSFPPFAGLDHQRVVRQRKILGKIAKLPNQEVIDRILDSPILAGYSVKRYLAAFDVARQLEQEGFSQDRRMLNSFFLYSVKSPYVPNTDRRRISQVINGEEPPLLRYMRKRLAKI